jgi:hypothetical protein
MRSKKYSALRRKLYKVDHKKWEEPKYVVADNHKEVLEIIEKAPLINENVEEVSIQFIDYVLEK